MQHIRKQKPNKRSFGKFWAYAVTTKIYRRAWSWTGHGQVAERRIQHIKKQKPNKRGFGEFWTCSVEFGQWPQRRPRPQSVSHSLKPRTILLIPSLRNLTLEFINNPSFHLPSFRYVRTWPLFFSGKFVFSQRSLRLCGRFSVAASLLQVHPPRFAPPMGFHCARAVCIFPLGYSFAG